MCLTCIRGERHIIHKENIPRVFYPNYRKLKEELGMTNDQINKFKQLGRTGITLYTFNNDRISLNERQIEEICDHALAIVVTGVDNSVDVWAVQWPNDYKVKTLKV